MLRYRIFGILALIAALGVASVYAKEKKDPAVDPAKKEQPATPKQPTDPKPANPKPAGPADPKPAEPKPAEPKPPEPKQETKNEPAKETNGLAWKFTVDKPFYQKMDISTDQTIKVMSLDVVQKQQQTFYFKWTPIKQEGDKWMIKQEIEGIQMKIDIAGNPVSFDSTTENAPGGTNTALAEFFKNLKGSSFTLTLNTKTMKVESVTGREEFLKKLSQANPQLNQVLQKILSEESLKQMAEPTFGFLPPTPKKVGESWDTTSTLLLGPIGTYKNIYKFTLKGPEGANKDVDVIYVDTTLEYAPPTESDPGLPFKIKDAKLKTKDKQDPGKIYFNTKLGRLEKAELTLQISGDLTIEIGGNQTNVNLNQTQTTTVTNKDESLLPKPPEPKKN